MRRPAAQLALTAVALVLGFLVVLQLRSTDPGADLAGRTAQELTVIIANLNLRNDQLRGEIAGRERDLRDLQGSRARGESTLGDLKDDLDRIRAWSGLEPVEGRGVRLTVAGPLDGEAAMDLLNELRNAGAEAMAVGGVRIVGSTVVAGPPGDLTVEGRPLESPLLIDAVGSPDGLTGALTRPGGIVTLLEATRPDVEVTVTPIDRLALPATSRPAIPAHGRPTL
jgi:uncharacterized protein YlxW (UPF0749 family)